MVVCGMGNVGPWVFDELLRGTLGAASEWQAILTSDGQLDIVELSVEADGAPDLESLTITNMRDRFPDFWKNLQMQLYSLKIRSVPPGSLRQGRKLRRIVDRRDGLSADLE